MTIPQSDQVEDLNDEALHRHLSDLIGIVAYQMEKGVPREIKEMILANLIDALDESDNMDTFGTEGWRKHFEGLI